MKNILPTTMGSLLVILIGIILGLKLNIQGDFPSNILWQPFVFIGFLYLLWTFFEMRIALLEPTKGQTKSEKLSSLYYAVSQGVTILSALWFSTTVGITFKFIFGSALLAFGIGIRLFAIHTLGRYYSHLVRIQEKHKIITTGPYRYIRHPAYTGMLLAHIGILIVFFNWITLLALCCGLIPGIVLRILNEERALASVSNYTTFARERKRLVPFIW